MAVMAVSATTHAAARQKLLRDAREKLKDNRIAFPLAPVPGAVLKQLTWPFPAGLVFDQPIASVTTDRGKEFVRNRDSARGALLRGIFRFRSVPFHATFC
ncbi:hypothetical protein GGD83_001743 [Rhodoblastus sphagnicola]|uniref:hypothetical protein n=1 Tax=Rhodoblastus sphagnicola TaxID=333368 RepID=UPI001304ABF4|nr:hypothetical protein [Rhodoblastus sphagnicola]MBB4197950.1 hypothetical protein [Rhodoblastus sphagnicola]